MQAAMLRATTAPLNTARAAADVLELCGTVLDAVRPSTVGDLGVAVLLSGAALEASTLTVRINLRDVADGDFRAATRDSLERLTLAAGSRHRLAQRVAARAGLAEPDAGPSASATA
jgi:formiminotetrahydrofolate cyclodeaminase